MNRSKLKEADLAREDHGTVFQPTPQYDLEDRARQGALTQKIKARRMLHIAPISLLPLPAARTVTPTDSSSPQKCPERAVPEKQLRACLLRLPVTCLLITSFLLGGRPDRANAQAKHELLEIPRIEEPIRLDGHPNEAAWQRIDPVPVAQYEPQPGAPPSERTEFRFAYDENYFYVSVRALDTTPDGIRSNTLYRDELNGSDHVEMVLDTYNDNETGLLFNTTPAGNRRDAAISNDASGGGIASGSWINANFDTYWSVETVVDQRGWFAEMRIPLSSLRVDAEDGRVVMGLIIHRKIARKNERVVFPAVEPNADWAFLKPSRARKIVLTDVESKRPVHVTPYGLAGMEQKQTLRSGGEERYVMDRTVPTDAGLDIKYRIRDNLSLDLTANTDFAQVEADDQRINLSRFSLFFPEKRQFFQERSGLFEFRTGGQSRLFHSRRIGLTKSGRPVRILGGARLVGRVGQWDLGLIEMQTAESRALPSENFGVVRLRRQVLNPYSNVGGLVTSRIGRDGSYNVTYGIDGLFRLVGKDYLSVKWAQTLENELIRSGNLTAVNSGRISMELERRRRRGFGYDVFLTRSGPNYRPGMGFVRRTDFVNADNTVSYTWMPDGDSPLLRHTIGLNGFAFLRNDDGSVESAAVTSSWEFTSNNQAGGRASLSVQRETPRTLFTLGGNTPVPPGRYTFSTGTLEFHTSPTGLLRAGTELQAGSFFDGRRFSVELTPTWSISKHLGIEGAYVFNYIEFPDRNRRFDSHLARLRIRAALNTALSLNSFFQYNSTANRISANTRFRYNFSEGSDLWVVYDEGLNTNLTRQIPTLPRTDSRSLKVKYTYTFHF